MREGLHENVLFEPAGEGVSLADVLENSIPDKIVQRLVTKGAICEFKDSELVRMERQKNQSQQE